MALNEFVPIETNIMRAINKWCESNSDLLDDTWFRENDLEYVTKNKMQNVIDEFKEKNKRNPKKRTYAEALLN
jgi:hypothetical protein